MCNSLDVTSKKLMDYIKNVNTDPEVLNKLTDIQELIECSSSLIHAADNYMAGKMTDEEFLMEWNLLNQQYSIKG